jgi:hypothetical protein
MQELKLNLENCYGINKLVETLDFRQSKIKNIYASNGFMKSSFAKVFIDLSNNQMPKDEIYPARQTICQVRDETFNELISNDIFVIESYKEGYESKKISTLLVNEALKKEYDTIYNNLETLKESLVSSLYSKSGISKSKLESELLNAKINEGQSFFEILELAKIDLETVVGIEFEGIKYDIIFNDKVKGFLETKGMQENLNNYIDKYNSLIENSQYLQPSFTHNNISTISTTLSKNGFFGVQNKIHLRKNDGSYKEVLSEDELLALIHQEKQAILTSPALQNIFQKIDDALEKNAELRNFRNVLKSNQNILLRLDNIKLLRHDFWISYFKECETQILELLNYYDNSKTRLLEIIEEAKLQETDWQSVVNEFNQKFNVPFSLVIENKSDVILNSKTPNINFIYKDRGEEQLIDDKKLKLVLSTGEKRALYILNIIFEIRARKMIGNDTILVIDDIADSFDYKNKYAIIEYLKEILDSNIFYMIVLTHNFDFFRTVASRLNINRRHCFMTLKNDIEIKLVQAGYLKNVFNHWKTKINTSNAILIASIPFVRNLIEYTLGETSSEYMTLTALLHIKEDSNNGLQNTETLELCDLEQIFSRTLLDQTFTFGDTSKVKEVIYLEAERISQLPENNDLENKIAISIAIRLKAEEYMINAINDSSFVNGIRSNQTLELYKEYKRRNPISSNLTQLAQVNLMTPENIHLNSFMYEPILDMSDRHLVELYNRVKNL